MTPPRVLLGAASPALRAGLRALLSRLTVAGECAAPADLPGAPGADVLVADADFLHGLADATFSLPLALVALAADEDALDAARTLGASGWALVPPDVTAGELLAAVNAVHAGLVALPPDLAGRVLGAESPTLPTVSFGQGDTEPLTTREREVLSLLTAGLPNKRIASRLSISENTVKFHLSALYSKLGVGSRAAAVREGVRRGLVSI